MTKKEYCKYFVWFSFIWNKIENLANQSRLFSTMISVLRLKILCVYQELGWQNLNKWLFSSHIKIFEALNLTFSIRVHLLSSLMQSIRKKKLRIIMKVVSFFFPFFSKKDECFTHESYEVEKIAIPFCFSLLTWYKFQWKP